MAVEAESTRACISKTTKNTKRSSGKRTHRHRPVREIPPNDHTALNLSR
jgi:hypothetical protein